MEDIARAAGITKAVLYDHFQNKGELHAEVVSRASDELVAVTIDAAGTSGEPRARFEAGILAAFRLIAQRPDVRTLLLGEPGADEQVSKASMDAQRRARAAMAALYMSEPSFLAGMPRRRERAEHIAQGAIGTMNALAVLNVEQGLTPEKLTGLAMDLLWPGMEVLFGLKPRADAAPTPPPAPGPRPRASPGGSSRGPPG